MECKISENVEFFGQTLEKGNYIKIEIEDNGTGITEEIKSRFFEPFNTTKEYGRGLGLPSAFGSIMTLNGYFNIISERQKGTTVQIFFPITK